MKRSRHAGRAWARSADEGHAADLSSPLESQQGVGRCDAPVDPHLASLELGERLGIDDVQRLARQQQQVGGGAPVRLGGDVGERSRLAGDLRGLLRLGQMAPRRFHLSGISHQQHAGPPETAGPHSPGQPAVERHEEARGHGQDHEVGPRHQVAAAEQAHGGVGPHRQQGEHRGPWQPGWPAEPLLVLVEAAEVVDGHVQAGCHGESDRIVRQRVGRPVEPEAHRCDRDREPEERGRVDQVQITESMLS